MMMNCSGATAETDTRVYVHELSCAQTHTQIQEDSKIRKQPYRFGEDSEVRNK